jgi:transcriptional regulator with XRE-family HTH domain
MKQIIPDGPRIKTLRLGLESKATQKELAYAVRVSERKLRQIENESAPISVATMELLAKNLGVHREQITVRHSAYSLSLRTAQPCLIRSFLTSARIGWSRASTMISPT